MQQLLLGPGRLRQAVRQPHGTWVHVWNVLRKHSVIQAGVRALADVQHERCPSIVFGSAGVARPTPQVLSLSLSKVILEDQVRKLLKNSKLSV